jgi:hypothetical protein
MCPNIRLPSTARRQAVVDVAETSRGEGPPPIRRLTANPGKRCRFWVGTKRQILTTSANGELSLT